MWLEIKTLMVDGVVLSTWCELRDKKSEAFLFWVCFYISRIGSKVLQSKILGTKASDEETWKPICYIQMSHIVQRWEAFQGVCFSFKLAGGASYNWGQMGKRKEKHPYHPPYCHSSGNTVCFLHVFHIPGSLCCPLFNNIMFLQKLSILREVRNCKYIV